MMKIRFKSRPPAVEPSAPVAESANDRVMKRLPGESAPAYYDRLKDVQPAELLKDNAGDLNYWLEGYQAQIRQSYSGAAEEHYASTLKSPYLRELFEKSTGLNAKRV